jgi:CubicO group peptidase (beta-lactamase class C family)
MMTRLILLFALCLCATLAVGVPTTAHAEKGHDSQALRLSEGVAKLQKKYKVASISVGLIRDGKVWITAAAGLADKPAGIKAQADTLYLLASCSKPVIGLAVAKLMELDPSFDLDADVNTYLKWPKRLENPDFPGKPITMRHLMRHRSGIAADADIDFPDYPRPDPDKPLDAFLQAQLSKPDSWEGFAPGASESYSNLGAALAALIVEKVSGQDFKTFCNEKLFDPLKLADTRWTFGELTPAQQARVAKPHDTAGRDLGHYGFNDYPSGLLRSSALDFTKLWAAVVSGGAYDGARILTEASVKAFEAVPMFIVHEGDTFSHTGGEEGTNTYFVYQKGGSGYVVLINSDLPDDDHDEDEDGDDEEVDTDPDALWSDLETLIKTFY